MSLFFVVVVFLSKKCIDYHKCFLVHFPVFYTHKMTNILSGSNDVWRIIIQNNVDLVCVVSACLKCMTKLMQLGTKCKNLFFFFHDENHVLRL